MWIETETNEFYAGRLFNLESSSRIEVVSDGDDEYQLRIVTGANEDFNTLFAGSKDVCIDILHAIKQSISEDLRVFSISEFRDSPKC